MSKKTTSPTNSKRGCLCKDGETYSKECCEGDVINQGVGDLKSYGVSNVQNTNEARTIVTVN